MSTRTGTGFYVELPAGEDGETSMPTAVVEAEFYPPGSPSPLDNPARPGMIPVAPEQFTRRWPHGWYADSYGGWAETDGPARMLSREEYDTVIRQLRARTTPPRQIPGFVSQEAADRYLAEP